MGNRVHPRSPADITTGWLTEALRHDGLDVEVASFRTSPVGEGVGLMGVVCRIELTYGRGSGPASVIGKFATTIDANLAIALHFDIYRREVLFYRHVAPLANVAVPHVYYAGITEGDDFAILLEDLGEHRRGDQVVGCTPSEAAACIDELSKLHSTLWDRVDDPRFEFAFLHSDERHSGGMRQAAIDGWGPMAANFPDAVPAFMNDARERYLAAVPAMQHWMATPPITFVHADFRLDNLLFGTRDDHDLVVTLDWQGVLRSKGVQDVGFLLSQSMPIEDRRLHEHALVARWHRGLVAGGVRGYSSDDAWLDYRKAVLYLWVYATVIAGALDPSNDRGRLLMSTMIERAATAIDDLDCLSLLPHFEVR